MMHAQIPNNPCIQWVLQFLSDPEQSLMYTSYHEVAEISTREELQWKDLLWSMSEFQSLAVQGIPLVLTFGSKGIPLLDKDLISTEEEFQWKYLFWECFVS